MELNNDAYRRAIKYSFSAYASVQKTHPYSGYIFAVTTFGPVLH